MVEASSTQPDSQKSSKMVEVSSSQPDSKSSPTVDNKSDNHSVKVQFAHDNLMESQEEMKESTEKIIREKKVDVAGHQQLVGATYVKNVEEIKKRTEKIIKEKKVDVARYQPLVMAIFDKNEKAVEDFINKNMERVVDACIDEFGSTIFHLIVHVPRMDVLVEKLLSLASPEFLQQRDMYYFTALHAAADVGNTKAVQLYVKKNRHLLTLKDADGFLPVHRAIFSGRYEDTVEYLISSPEARIENSAEQLADCRYVLLSLIRSNHIDLAMDFLNQYPKSVARDRNPQWNRTINALARKDLELPSGSLQSLIYHYIPVKVEKHNSRSEHGDVENQTQISRKGNSFGKLQCMLWNTLKSLVPGIKSIHDQKLRHEQTLEIVRLMIGGVTWTYTEALDSLKTPIFTAAKSGNYRFVEEILKAYNYSYMLYDKYGRTIFHFAILHRQEKVFSLIHNQPLNIRNRIIDWATDDTKCNVLYLAGKLVPSNKARGAALQMQRELQWFKAVKEVFHSKIQKTLNADGKTPQQVFTEEHEKLVKEGEKWMKDAATAGSVVAALIVTVVFATAYTFPGGINGEGIPNFIPRTSFKLFLVSIALALFSSISSVEMFLGILTSRYAEDDFLESLPKKLIIGLITLFFSIASMMVAFASTFHIFLKPWKWATIPVVVLVFVPVTLFAFMQFSLLVDIYKSTYGFSALKKKM